MRRLLGLIPVLFGITLVVFLLMQLIPGDVAQAMLGLTAGPQDVANLRQAVVGDHKLTVLLKRLFLPAVTLGTASAAIIARTMRSRCWK